MTVAVKTITFTLTAGSIGQAIREMQKYRDDFKKKCTLLRQRVAERIAWSASSGFSTALAADIIFGEPKPSEVKVDFRHEENVSIVFAEGDQAVFIEYGAGIHHNGPAGNSPHPWGAKRGYLIGSYGLGKGEREAWGYYVDGDKNNLVVTHGTPAAMPMYNGVKEAVRVIDELVREVFG